MTDETELKIARKLVTQAVEQGYLVSVSDGEETTVTRSNDLETIVGALATTDMDWLTFHTPMGLRTGAVLLVWGNGTDLISDYASNDLDALAAWLKPIDDYADELAAG